MTLANRKTLENSCANNFAVDSLTSEQFQQWKNFRSVWSELVWEGRSFRLYNTEGALDNFRITDCGASFKHGLEIEITFESSSEAQWLDHKPCKLRGHDIYAWVPFLPKVRYMDNGKGSPYSFSFPLNFKTAHSPDYMHPNYTYICASS